MQSHFAEYNDICNQISEVNFKLETLENGIYGIKGVSYDQMPKGTSHMTIVDKLAKKNELVEQISELQKVKQVLYNKHIEEIAKVEDNQHKSVLRCYYLLRMKMDEIASMLCVTTNRVYQIKREAVKEFKLKNDL